LYDSLWFHGQSTTGGRALSSDSSYYILLNDSRIFHLDVIGWSGSTDCLMQRLTTSFEDSKYKPIKYVYIVFALTITINLRSKISPDRDYLMRLWNAKHLSCVLGEGRSQTNTTSVGSGSILIAIHALGISMLPRTAVALYDRRN
jgi:hypothetical protein